MLDNSKGYLVNEINVLRNEMERCKDKRKRIKSVPLSMGQFAEAIDINTAIVGLRTSTNTLVKNINRCR